MSRVTKITQLGKNYTKSQLNMNLKITLDQDRKDVDSFGGQEEFTSFETDCVWKVNDSIILNSFIETLIEYVIDIPITHDVFQGTEQNGECQHTYELSDDLLT